MKAETSSHGEYPATLSVFRAGVVAAAVALAVNLLIWGIGSLLGISFAAEAADSAAAFHVSAGNVILDTLVAGIAATLVFTLLVRGFSRPIPPFLIVSGLVLLGSFLMPLLLDTDAPTKAALSLMHIAAAVIIVGGLTRQVRQR